MENFKGSQGDWCYEIDEFYNHASIYSTDGRGNIAEVYYTDGNISETPYNFNLMSHSKEMLELLSELMNNKSFTSHLPTTALIVNDLIRRATTI